MLRGNGILPDEATNEKPFLMCTKQAFHFSPLMTQCALSGKQETYYDRHMLRVLLLFTWLLSCSISYARYAVFTRETEDAGFFSFLSADDRIDVHFFSGSDHMIYVLDEGKTGKAQGGSLAEAMRRNDCIAGVNGGYFAADRDHTPLGILRHEGKQKTPLATKGFTVSGILYDTGKKLKLERSHALSTPVEQMEEALQGGPFLVEKGKVVSGLNNDKKARRTFIATDERGNWCIGISSALTLHQLASWLAQPDSLGNFQVQKALNLDGGTSSAFWDKQGGIYLPGSKNVRNYVGVKKRPSLAEKNDGRGNKKPARQMAAPASRK